MDAVNDVFEGFNLTYDELFSLHNILKILLKTNSFLEWLEKYHPKEKTEQIFHGYKFTVLITYRSILRIFCRSDVEFIPFEEDKTLNRIAHYIDKSILDAPNTCKKTIFLKNLLNLSEGLDKARNFKSFEKKIKHVRPVIDFLDFYYNENIEPVIDVTKTKLLTLLSLTYIKIYYFDGSRDKPWLVNSIHPFEMNITSNYLNIIRKGYVYSLQYLWHYLIGTKHYEQSKIANLHCIFQKIKSKVRDDGPNIEPKDPFWIEIDKYFTIADGDILLTKGKDNFEYFKKGVLKFDKEKFVEQDFTTLLNKTKEPDYILLEDRNSKIKKLESLLFWYPFEVIGFRTGRFFSGVQLFISMLAGIVELRKINNNQEEIYVKIFEHPLSEDNQDKNYISFGILVERYSLFADSSGWMIFHNCATDFSGTGGFELDRALNTLIELSRIHNIKVDKIKIGIDLFNNYLDEKGETLQTSRLFHTIGKEKIEEKLEEYMLNNEKLISNISEFKGMMFELVIFYYLQSSNLYDELYCYKTIKTEIIDVYTKKDNEISIFECKMNIHYDDIQKIISQVNKQSKAIKDLHNECKVKKNLVVFHKISSERKKLFQESKINVFDDFKSLIQSSKLFEKSRRRILNLLEFNG